MRRLTPVWGALLLASCDLPSERLTALQLCEQTVFDYAQLRDEGPAADYADLFTADGRFTLGPNETKGRSALIARHKSANKAALWRHHMLDVKVKEDAGALTGVTRFLIYTAPHPAPAKNPREIIGDYLDDFVIEEGRCKIVSRRVRIVFDD